jgi:hypothetical protein
MKLVARLKHHFRSLAVDTAYFSAWIGTLILLKTLVLQEYRIGFVGWSKVLAGALVLGKVVRILGHVPFGAWVRARPAWVEVLLRTALYSAGLAAVLVLGDAFEFRHEHGGIVGALKAMHRDASFPHLLVNSICLTGAFLFYNILAVLRAHLGGGELFRLFLKPLPKEPLMPTQTK